MFVGWARFDLHLPEARSLKDKRQIIRSLMDTVHARMRAAAAEVEHQDLHQRASLGFAVVSNEAGHAKTLLEEIARRVETAPGVMLLSRRDGLVGEDDE